MIITENQQDKITRNKIPITAMVLETLWQAPFERIQVQVTMNAKAHILIVLPDI